MNDQSGFCHAILGLQFLGENYVFVRPLDKGEFGQIWVGRDLKRNTLVAIKQMSLKNRSQYNMQLIKRELSIMKQLEKNENIIEYIEHIHQGDQLYIIMELCQQNLHAKISQIRKQKGSDSVALTENEAIYFMKQILSGFKSLRKQKIIHRDVKLKNILVKGDVLKIADFGLAIKQDYATSQVGTPYTKAPEVFDGVQSYSDKADIWSLGVIFYQMLFNLNYPFPAKEEKELQHKIRQNMISFKQQDIEISGHTLSLLNQMLQKEPGMRITWEELFNHPLFNESSMASSSYLRNLGRLKRNASVEGFSTPLEGLSFSTRDVTGRQSESIVPVSMKEEDDQQYSIPRHSAPTKTSTNMNVTMKGNQNGTTNRSVQCYESQSSTVSSGDQQSLKNRSAMNQLQETLINSFVLNKIDISLNENSDLQKFSAGAQFELSLLLLVISERIAQLENELVEFHQILHKEAKLNILQHLSEPRKLQEITMYDQQKFLKCMKKYFASLMSEAKVRYTQQPKTTSPMKLLDHANDILKCSVLSHSIGNHQKIQRQPSVPPKDNSRIAQVQSKFLDYFENLHSMAQRVF